MPMFEDFYRGKTVLVTGHTGFKGSWLSMWLLELGAKVIGYALDPYTERDNFVLAGLSDKLIDVRADINDRARVLEVIQTHQPDLIFHLAAQPLVRESYTTPLETYQTNVMGTLHVLEAIKTLTKPVSAVMVTTDKCYHNKEQLWGYREDDALGGYDPYSSSKAAAELAIASWRQSFFNPLHYEDHHKSIASVRAGNVIGGGDWAKDRIIPDCIRALEASSPIDIRNPQATRPWQHVLEPLYGYLLLGSRLAKEPTKYAEAWNFGPPMKAVIPVWEVAKSVVKAYGQGEVRDMSTSKQPHEARLLALDITKAMSRLAWKPVWSVQEALKMTVAWYLQYQQGDGYQLNQAHLQAYEKALKQHG